MHTHFLAAHPLSSSSPPSSFSSSFSSPSSSLLPFVFPAKSRRRRRMYTPEMFKSWSQKGKDKLSSARAFLVNPIFSKKRPVAGEAAPKTELTAPGADFEGIASRELIMSENDMAAAVATSGGASSPGHHPEPSTRPAAVGRARLNQFGGNRDGRRHLPNPTMPGSSSNRVAGQPRLADAGVGLECESRLSNRLLGATQSSAGIMEQDEGPIPDPEFVLVSNEDSDAPVSGEDGDAPVSGVRAYLNIRDPLQTHYNLFGLGTNLALALINVKVIHELKLPGSTPTLFEGVLAAAAGIGLLTSLAAICLLVKDIRSALAKVLSQISAISLGFSLLVLLSACFLFEQYMPVNIVTPTLFEGVLAAAAGIGMLTNSSAICLRVKDPRSAFAKVLSEISDVFLGSLLLVMLSTRFLFEQYMLVNTVTTAVLSLIMVGVVFWAGRSTAVNQVAGARAVSG